MNALSELLNLPEREKLTRGLVHTSAEIAQQPYTWLLTFELFRSRQSEIAEFLALAGLRPNVDSRPTVFLIGAGTSDYVGGCLTHLLRKCWQCEVIAVPSTDLLTHMDDWIISGRKYLWISFSRSGDSPEGVAVLQRAREKHPDIYHLIVSCNANGRMIRESARGTKTLAICLDDAVNDRGLAMTSSFSNMVIFGQCLAHFNAVAEYEKVIAQLVESGRAFLPQAADSTSVLARDSYPRCCFVGSGPLRSVAKESALKLLEMTAGKTQTMSESVLGLRHGPMAALDQDTLLVCFASSDQRIRQYEHDLLEEIGQKRLVRTRIVVGSNEISESKNFAEHFLTYATPTLIGDDYRPVLDVIFGQLLGLFFSLHWKLQPDCPSPNGAISRVVSSVKIYS